MYRGEFDGVLLQCVEWANQQIAMHTFHDGTFDDHFSGCSISRRLIRMRYYWSMMERDYHNYIKKYVKYQQHTNLTNVPSQVLQQIQAMCPFYQ